MSLHFVTLDVFTSTRCRGNPLAIIDVPKSVILTPEQKQLIAREFNLSESVFLHEQTEDDKIQGDVRIDIYTPIAEIPFAGHPTVGTSNYLLRYLKDNPAYQQIKALQTKAGRVPVTLSDGGNGIQLQVAHNVHIHDNPFPDRAFSHHPVVSIVKGMTSIHAKQASLEELASHNASFLGTENTYKSQESLDEGWRVGPVSTYCYVDLGKDEHGVRQLRTRCLSSREDPATGSAASGLCSYLTLSEDGPGIRQYQVTQGVEMGRRSEIYIQVKLKDGGKAIEEVLLSGTAVKVMEGQIDIP